jgi:GntR family transcriptional regulator/MocR family aminotransferase
VLRHRLADNGVLIEAGNPFFAGEDSPRNFFRLAYSSISSERIPEGIRRISQAIKEY